MVECQHTTNVLQARKGCFKHLRIFFSVQIISNVQEECLVEKFGFAEVERVVEDCCPAGAIYQLMIFCKLNLEKIPVDGIVVDTIEASMLYVYNEPVILNVGADRNC